MQPKFISQLYHIQCRLVVLAGWGLPSRTQKFRLTPIHLVANAGNQTVAHWATAQKWHVLFLHTFQKPQQAAWCISLLLLCAKLSQAQWLKTIIVISQFISLGLEFRSSLISWVILAQNLSGGCSQGVGLVSNHLKARLEGLRFQAHSMAAGKPWKISFQAGSHQPLYRANLSLTLLEPSTQERVRSPGTKP